jgi:hypothetical protein
VRLTKDVAGWVQRVASDAGLPLGGSHRALCVLMRAKPNDVTRFAQRHPVLWVLGSALGIALVGLAIFGDWRASTLGGATTLVANWYLWRPPRAWTVLGRQPGEAKSGRVREACCPLVADGRMRHSLRRGDPAALG